MYGSAVEHLSFWWLHSSILLFLSKLALLASFKRIFYLEQGKEGLFEYKLKNIKMVAILE